MQLEERLFRPIIIKNTNLPWREIIHLGTPLCFPPRRELGGQMEQGCDGLYFILKGIVRLSYLASNGQDKVLFYIGENALFNEVPVVVGVQSCLFTCMERVEAVFFAKKDIYKEELWAKYPTVMLSWLEAISLKSNIFFSQLCSAGLYDSFTNVCRLLYSMSIHNREDNKIIPYLSQQDFASIIGIHRGSLHKAFTRLRKEHVIGHYSRKELVIHNLAKLRQYAAV